MTEPPRVEWVPGQLYLDDGLAPRSLSLFSGYGGLDMAVHAALGTDLIAVADNDPAASAVLAHRYPGVPNLGDVTRADWRSLGRIDVVVAGFPCQDVSSAGLRLGLVPGTRSGLWAHVAAAVDELRPGLVVIENVRGLLSARAHHPAHRDMEPCPWCMDHGADENLRALGAVLGDLADVGYDAAWRVVQAPQVGGAHGRARVVCLAWPAAADPGSEVVDGGPGLWQVGPTGIRRGRSDDGDREAAADPGHRPDVGQRARPAPGGRGAADADADGDGLARLEGAPAGRDTVRADVGGDADRCDGRAVPDADGAGLAGPDGAGRARAGRRARADVRRPGAAGRVPDVEWGKYGPAVRRWAAVLGRPAPAPVIVGARGPVLSPQFVEWLMGLPAGWVTDVPGLSRTDMLKLLGNGVMPQQIAAGIRSLLPHVPAPPASCEAGGAA